MRASLIIAGLLVLVPAEARAVRWTLGVATELTPVVIDPDRPDDLGTPLRIGVRPVVELELSHYLAFGAYAPFVVYRSNEGDAAGSSGAESVFGLTGSFRVPVLRDSAPEEILIYGTGRFGFGTVNGRAGPFLGGGLGAAFTWLSTGRGFFAELDVGHVAVSNVVTGRRERDVDRTTVGLTVGLVFRLGGGDWRIGRTALPDEDDQ